MKNSLKILSLLSILFLMLGASCNIKSINYSFNLKMESNEVLYFMYLSNNIVPILYSDISDNCYALPTKEWVKNKFTPYFQKFLFDNNLRTFHEDSNDCDKYVNYAISCGHLLFNKENIKGAGLAIGEFDYFTNLQRHAVVFFIINDNGKPKLMFYEPQSQEFFELEKDQKEKLCTSWRI